MPGQDQLKNRNVVIGVDGTDLSMAACEHVAGMVAAFGARAIVVFVKHIPAAAAEPDALVAIGAVMEGLDELESQVRAQLEAMFAGTSVPWSLEVRSGDPADEIIAVAHEHNAVLVAVGATIHGAFASLLLSSVAEHLLHHSDVSLLVVRPEKNEA
jgi:nucleotide-binding universal stress UspA family protein